MGTDPLSRALSAVARARSAAFRRALARGACVFVALGAGSLALTYALFSILSLRVPDVLSSALLGLSLGVSVRVGAREALTPVAAALLLDRAAGTRERFTAALLGRDPEVRALAAEQALRREPFASGGFPLRLSPPREAPAAALSALLLTGVLLLAGAPRPTADGPPEGPAAPARGAAPGATGEAPAMEPSRGAPAAPAPAAAEALVSRLAAGGTLTAEEWEALERRGGRGRPAEGGRAAAARGDGEEAAAAVRNALRRAAPAAAPGIGAEERAAAWQAFGASLENPSWPARFDGAVRGYFAGVDGSALAPRR